MKAEFWAVIKQSVSLLLAVIFVLGLIPFGITENLSFNAYAANSEQFTENGFTYIINDGKAQVTYCTQKGDVTIPSELGGYPVTSIGSGKASDIFSYTAQITSVTIPEGVTHIGICAFKTCEQLTEIVIPDSVTHIGDWAFEDCGSLKKVTLGKGLKNVGRGAFDYCNLIGYVYYTGDIKSWCEIDFESFGSNPCELGVQFFINNVIQKEVQIPSSVTEIKNYTFAGCESITKIRIPDSVTSVGIAAFMDTGLVFLDLPDSIMSIGDYAFSGCNFEQAYLPVYMVSIGCRAFENCRNLKSITIPYGITKIDLGAFRGCLNLKTICIPNTVKLISDGALNHCEILQTIYYYGSEEQWDKVSFSWADHDYVNSEAKIEFISSAYPGTEELETIRRVIYNANGGEDEPPTVLTENGTNLTISSVMPKRTGYTFMGWSESATATTAEKTPGDSLLIEKDVTLYAVWKKAEVLSAGVTGNAPITFKHQEYFYSFEPQEDGEYVFYTTVIDSTRLSVYDSAGVLLKTGDYGANRISYTLTKGNTYYFSAAYYSVKIGKIPFTFGKVYTITFDANSGSSAPENQFKDHDKMITLSFDTPKRSGYSFLGWAKSKTATTPLYTAGSSYSENENVTLYAVWDLIPIKQHTVTYNYSNNGGSSVSQDSATVNEGADIPLTPTAKKSGWGFVGWNTNPNATTALTSLKMGTTDVTLYAVYKKTLIAEFVDYNGTSQRTRTANVTIYNNAKSGTVTAQNQGTYSGWTANGWSTSTSADASAVTSFTISSNTTYYGLYKKTVKLSYDANGGSSTPSAQNGTCYTNSYAAGTVKKASFTLANAISKAGSTFSGWAADSVNGNKYGAGTTISLSKDTVMYAVWDAFLTQEEIFSFKNDKADFFTASEFQYKKYYISDNFFSRLAENIYNYYTSINSLLKHRAESIINSCKKMRESSWEGSCYGMAVVTLLDKGNYIAFNENYSKNGARSLYEVEKPNVNSDVRSAINYYALSQQLSIITDNYIKSGVDNKKTNSALFDLVEMSKTKPILFCYSYKVSDDVSKGHAIVIKGFSEEGDCYKLLTYDNRYPDDETYILIDKEYTFCKVINPAENVSENAYYVQFMSDMSCFDVIDIDGADNFLHSNSVINQYDKYTEIFLNANDRITVKNSKGEYLEISNGFFEGTMPVQDYCLIVNSNIDGTDEGAVWKICIDNTDKLTFTSEGQEMKVSVINKDIFADVVAKNADEIVVENDGAKLSGENADFEISLSVKNDYADMIQLQGCAENDVMLSNTDSGVTVSGVSGEYDLTVYYDTVKEENISFSTEYNDILIIGDNSDKNVVDILASQKNDGIYDTSILNGTEISFDAEYIIMSYKEKRKINLNVPVGKNVKYSSSNPSAVTVDADGNITAVRKGSAVITATIEGTDISAECVVRVEYTFWQWLIYVLLFGWIWY